MEVFDRCVFCAKKIGQDKRPPRWQDKHWRCEVCQFAACGACLHLHLELAHPAVWRIYRDFKYLLESGKVKFFPWKK